MEDWKECTLGDICNSVSVTYNRKDNDVVLINTSDVLEGKFLTHETVPNSNLKGQFKKTFQKNDILYSEIRPANKRYAFVDFENTENYIASTKLMVIRPNTELVLPRYLYAILTSNDLISEMQQLAETRSGTFPQITFSSELATYNIHLPPLATQKKIAEVLSSLDAKIELNNKINANLEQQAQAIFKSWFVDFEPFGGEMPAGWKEVPLEDLCSVVTKGTTPTTLGKQFTEVGINFIKGESILDNHTFDLQKISHIDEETNQLLKRSIIQPNDVLFTIAGTLGRFAIIDESLTPANTNQAIGIIRADTKKVSPYFLYSIFIGNWHNDYYTKRIQQAVQANLSLGTIKSLPIIIPDEENMTKYTNVIEPIFKQMKQLELENKKLSTLRDTLLPKLMNGEIDI